MPFARPLPALVLFAALLPTAGSAEKPRKPPPPQPAQTYPMHDTHPQEQVTIAAEPCDTKPLTPDFRLDYLAHGMMPIRVIVTNDSGQPLTLDDARIHLISANNDNLRAATLDDLQRRLFSLKSATGHKVPLPLPIPVPITTGKQNVDKKILDDDRDFSFQTTTVPPHSTVAGYLFYDVQGLTDNASTSALTHATLELRKVRFAARPNSSAEYLDSFEIPLSPTKP
jgi:hypothetical protein